ncbi:MAG: adenylate/guanylate cyclase domain-containing protein [Chitinophagaceae bacterium]|nr:MAG: adenylate/guanylate cyclase domain-containing protein [Chitinophagaceae bacterium]
MSQSRQLLAIMFTDIVGYTALMGHDEQKAFALLTINRSIQKPIIEQFGGSWIKELGDGVMASFNTVSDAVNAAMKIQEGCLSANEFQLRIGIHQGEVVLEAGDVFGDAVNIAARIQAAAKPGAIYISETVQHNVSNKAHIQTKFVKEEALKNVKEPVRIYEVLLFHDVVAPFEIKLKPASRASIAVLPFANMSSDPEQEYFSDGLTEEIISDLSKVNTLLVISRSSIMTFKGTQKKLKDIADEVSVRYILEGSVRKAGNNLRISAQLIDAESDSHLWSEKYNGTLEDIFDIQEKVSLSIVDALKLKLTPQEEEQIAKRPITNVHAYECYLKAKQGIFGASEESMQAAFKLLQNGLDLIGPNELLYATLGYGYFFYHRFVNKTDRSYFSKAKEYVAKAFAINPDSPLAHVVLGWAYWTEGALHASCKAMQAALHLDPNNSDALFGLAEVYLYAGKAADAHALTDKLLEIDPLSAFTYIMKASRFLETNIADGLPYFEKAYAMDPQNPIVQWMLACAYFWCGKNEEGYPLVDSIAKALPDWAFTHQLQFLKFGLQGDKQKALGYASKPELEIEAANDHHFAFHLAECYSVIDDKEKALDLLEYSMKIFFPYKFLTKNILFDNIKNEERFAALMEEGKQKSEAFKI